MKPIRLALFSSILAVFLASTALAADPHDRRTVRASGPSSARTPVIFVHGLYADDWDLWFVAKRALLAAGYVPGDITDLHYVSLEGVAPAAAQLATEVDWLLEKTGKSKVAIVSHSLGSLVTKLCVVEGGCKGKVSHWASLAGANNGTNFVLREQAPVVTDVDPNGALLVRLNAQAAKAFAEQAVQVQVQWSPGDTSILPPTLSQEPFAENVVLPATVTHQSILFDLDVTARTLQFLAR